jgi:hypothetical protein
MHFLDVLLEEMMSLPKIDLSAVFEDANFHFVKRRYFWFCHRLPFLAQALAPDKQKGANLSHPYLWHREAP